MSHFKLDTRGLLCPMPVIRTQDQVESLQSGDVLEILCSDPGALNDIPAWCRINGHRVVDTQDHGREQVVIIEVGEQDG